MLTQIANIQFNPELITANGIFIAVVGYVVVFSALICLYFVFRLIPKLIHFKRKSSDSKLVNTTEDDFHMSGEVNAAIAMSIYLYMNSVHDHESNIITIKKVTKTYSPWSSKIYNMGLRPRN